MKPRDPHREGRIEDAKGILNEAKERTPAQDRARFLDDLSPEDLEWINRTIYNNSALKTYMEKNPLQRKESAREKARLVVDWLQGVMMSSPFQMRFLVWALSKPGEFAKMYLSTQPKNVEIEVTANKGVVLIPQQSAGTEEWLKEHGYIDVEPEPEKQEWEREYDPEYFQAGTDPPPETGGLVPEEGCDEENRKS